MSPLRRFVTERRFVMQKRLMKDYVTHVLNRNDANIEMLLQDNDPMESGLLNFAEMNITLNTLAASMEEIANQLFATGFQRYHVAALFMYSIKLDEYLKNNHEQKENYDTNLLANILVNILLNIGYVVPTQSYCTII